MNLLEGREMISFLIINVVLAAAVAVLAAAAVATAAVAAVVVAVAFCFCFYFLLLKIIISYIFARGLLYHDDSYVYPHLQLQDDRL